MQQNVGADLESHSFSDLDVQGQPINNSSLQKEGLEVPGISSCEDSASESVQQNDETEKSLGQSQLNEEDPAERAHFR